MKIKNIKNIEGTFELVTGTRVGGSSDIIEIGGNDSPIVRNPLTKELYIPGSSIKGKMRMLTEWLEGKIDETGKVHSCSEENCSVCRVFGRGAEDSKKAMAGTTRISVKDAYLTDDSKEKLIKLRDRIGMDTEWKYENNINRLTSEAQPRNSERIPAGVSFNFTISYKVFDLDDEGKIDEELFEKIVIKSLKALSLEGIGGGVSRGNGQIRFTKLDVDGVSYLEKMTDFKF